MEFFCYDRYKGRDTRNVLNSIKVRVEMCPVAVISYSYISSRFYTMLCNIIINGRRSPPSSSQGSRRFIPSSLMIKAVVKTKGGNGKKETVSRTLLLTSE